MNHDDSLVAWLDGVICICIIPAYDNDTQKQKRSIEMKRSDMHSKCYAAVAVMIDDNIEFDSIMGLNSIKKLNSSMDQTAYVNILGWL